MVSSSHISAHFLGGFSLVVERYLLKFIDLEIFSFLFFGRHELGDDFFARDGPGSCLETLRVIRETCGT